jgi:hypothetical protein
MAFINSSERKAKFMALFGNFEDKTSTNYSTKGLSGSGKDKRKKRKKSAGFVSSETKMRLDRMTDGEQDAYSPVKAVSGNFDELFGEI